VAENVVTEAQKQVIREFWRMGLPHVTVAEQAGCTKAEVRRVLSREPRHPSNEPFSADLVAQTIQLYNLRVSPKKIADMFGIKVWKVYEILKERLPIEQRQFQGRRGVRLTAETKRSLRREYRQFLQALSSRTRVSVRTLREVLK
jgi:hypothetical protein